MLVVNLFGAPGAGKSTGAAYIFAKLKLAGVNAELVTEVAKDYVWDENYKVLKNQHLIFAQQLQRVARLEGAVDVVITDSPLLLSVIYKPSTVTEVFDDVVFEEFNRFNNINIVVKRVKEFNPVGRIHNQHESDQLYGDIKKFLDDNDVKYNEVSGNIEGYDSIIADIVSKVS